MKIEFIRPAGVTLINQIPSGLRQAFWEEEWTKETIKGQPPMVRVTIELLDENNPLNCRKCWYACSHNPKFTEEDLIKRHERVCLKK